MDRMIGILRFFEYPITAFSILCICPVIGWIIERMTTLLNRVLFRISGKNTVADLVNKFTIFGVIHHELSHALFAFITGAKVQRIGLYEPVDKSLGSVTYSVRGPWYMQAIQHTMSAIAPVACGVVSLTCIYRYITENGDNIPLWGLILIVYIFISIFLHMRMSKSDLDNMKKGFGEVLILLTIVVSCFKFTFLDYFM